MPASPTSTKAGTFRGGAANVSARLTEVLGKRVSEVSATELDGIMGLWQAVQGLTLLAQPVSVTQTDKIRDLLHRLLEYRTVIQPSSANTIESSRDMIEGALVSLEDRADTWLIRELIGLDPEMTESTNYGFVVPLRLFARLAINQIETYRAKWYRDKEKYLRICRLRGIYKTDLIQKFANLFVRGGLEDHRNEEHRRLFKRCAQNLFPGD